MITIAILIEIYVLMGMIWCIYMLYRNNKVADYRHYLLEQIRVAGKLDIANGRNWQWRYDEYETVSYNEMMWRFWKPIDSFYPNHDFIDASVKKGEL